MAPSKSKKTTSVSSIQYRGQTYKDVAAVEDTILVNPDKGKKPYIAKIHKIEQASNLEDSVLHVTWYYRPEEAVGGRLKFHGKDEIFESDHKDTTPVGAIMSKCAVYSLEEYEKRTVTSKDKDFFTRFKYKAAEKKYQPDTVLVYCTCEQPYNPDNPMIMCDVCEEWYHPSCLGLHEKILDDIQHNGQGFVCPRCKQDKKPRVV